MAVAYPTDSSFVFQVIPLHHFSLLFLRKRAALNRVFFWIPRRLPLVTRCLKNAARLLQHALYRRRNAKPVLG